ncbi:MULTISPECIES: hypothetical protein [Chitinophagaceae]
MQQQKRLLHLKIIYEKKLFYCVFIILATSILLLSCRKDGNSDNGKSSQDKSSAQTWLKENGGIYNKETISVLSPNKNIEKGYLNWDKLQTYTSDSNNYIEIPFYFENVGPILKGNDSLKGISFTLVLRKNKDSSYTGAIRNTVYGSSITIFPSGKRSIRTIESYQLLDGTPASFWYQSGNNTFTEGKPLSKGELKTYLLSIKNQEITSGGGKNSELMLAPSGGDNCETIKTTIYSAECTVIGNPEKSGQYDCIAMPTTTSYLICNTNIISGTPIDGTTGGGATAGSGNGSTTSWPISPNQFDLSSIDDHIPSVICTKSIN